MTKIVSAFPGTGKTYFCNHTNLKVTDSDSSNYSRIKKNVKNPDFPNNYIIHIKDCIGRFDIILISSHEVVRTALGKEELEYSLVYPCIGLKKDYIERFKQRGSSKEFITLVSDNWNKWISELEQQVNCSHFKLGKGQYLSDILNNYE